MQNTPALTTSANGFQELTGQDCTEILRSLSESLDHFGIAVHESSDLGTMIREISWMGSFGPESLSARGARSVDPRRVSRAFLYILQARDIERTLAACRHAKGDRSKIGKIRGKLNRLHYQDVPAQNALFELDVASKLIRADFDVEFSVPPRPDVVCFLDGLAIGLECKRVQNRERLRERLKEAQKQIANQDLPAAVIIDVQPLLYGTKNPDKRVPFDLVDSFEQLRIIQSARLKQLALSVTDDVEKAFDGGVNAVALCAMVWGLSKKPSAYVWCWIVEPLVAKMDYDSELADAFHAILRTLKER